MTPTGFTAEELSYLRDQRLGRLATVDEPNDSAVIPARAHSFAYLSTQALFSAAVGACSSTSADPVRTTMSPPLGSPRKFKVTFGLWRMLRIRAPGWL